MSGRSHVLDTNSLILKLRFSNLTTIPPLLRLANLRFRQHRKYTTARSRDAPSIGILGGGITGLATAYHLSRQLPKAHITIYEKSDRTGGWVNSRQVDVPGGQALFETGCRSLRSGGNGIVTAHLIQQLNLQNDVLYTSQDSPSAKNRYIYYPDRLAHLPGPGMSAFEILGKVLFEPVLQGVISGLWRELTTDARPDSQDDESVGDFLSRRVSPKIAQNVASAVMHGIYAGDVWQLSARSLLPLQWYLEKQHGGIMKGLVNVMPNQLMKAADVELRQELRPDLLDKNFGRQISESSVFTFKKGLQQLPDRLREVIETRGVQIKKNTTALLLRYQENEKAIDVSISCQPIQ